MRFVNCKFVSLGHAIFMMEELFDHSH